MKWRIIISWPHYKDVVRVWGYEVPRFGRRVEKSHDISVITYWVKTGQFETQLERNISLGKAKFLGLDHTFHIWFCFKLCGRITESRDRALLFQEVISSLRRTSFQFTRHLSAYSVPSTQHWTLEISMNKTWFLPSEVAGGRGVHMPVKCFC